jgi:large subunit ribosomal protein L17
VVQIITLGKRGDPPSYARASAFLLNASLLPKLFSTFAERYADRPGGYTRIHKFGHRPGDNAPHAILELVGNPRDLRFDIVARTLGWEILQDRLKSQEPLSLVNEGVKNVLQFIEKERKLGANGCFREKTRWNLQKVLKFGDKSAVVELAKRAADYIVRRCLLNALLHLLTRFIGQDSLLARPMLMKKAYSGLPAETVKHYEKYTGSPTGGAGKRLPGETASALVLARRAMGRQSWRSQRRPSTRSVVLSGSTI